MPGRRPVAHPRHRQRRAGPALARPGALRLYPSFYSPLRCAGRLYPQGQKIPFTITVRITQASLVGAVAIATRINATYRNRTRINLTPCVGVLGHDSARYHGQLTPLP